jgi:integrase
VELTEAQLSQLTLSLVAALKPVSSETPPPPELPLFGELVAAWLAKVEPTRVDKGQDRRLTRHLRSLSLEDESTLTAGMIEDVLHALATSSAPGVKPALSKSTINKVQGAGRKVIDQAMREKRWHGPNPFKLVRRAKETAPKYELLSLEELALVQKRIPEPRMGLFRCALHLGMRTGELLALRKEDVDFKRGVVVVRRSHGRDTTKTGRERVVPIVPAIAGDLLHAIEGSPGDLVFGGVGGKRQRADTKLTRVLRTAMVAAGIGVQAVTYKCRRRGCRRVEVGGAPVLPGHRCECGAKFWAVPEVRKVRWYDLRHMSATFHHQHDADPICVALALGHSIAGTTGRVYTHPSDETMRRELGRWFLAR